MPRIPWRIRIDVYYYQKRVDSTLLGLWGTALNNRLAEISKKSLNTSVFRSIWISIPVLRHYIGKCMEELVVSPELDFAAYWYSISPSLPSFYTPLVYFGGQTTYVMSKSAAAAIGEGVAGFVSENIFGIDLICRPIGIAPDLLGVKNGVYYLIEAKATSSKGNIVDGLKKAIKTLVEIIKSELSAEYVNRGEIAGMGIVTYFEKINRFLTYVIEMTTR